MSVRLFIMFVGGMAGEAGRVDRQEGTMRRGDFHMFGDREGGQEGRGQWGGGISQMECLGGDTLPEQCWVTHGQLV